MKNDVRHPPTTGDAAVMHRSRLARAFYGTAGFLALALGVAGIFLPGLPATPFVLLAAACFARASPRVHGWILRHRLIGPLVRDWQKHHSLTRRTKLVAIGTMTLMVAVSAWTFTGQPWIQGALALLGCTGAWVVLRIPTRPPQGGKGAARRG